MRYSHDSTQVQFSCTVTQYDNSAYYYCNVQFPAQLLYCTVNCAVVFSHVILTIHKWLVTVLYCIVVFSHVILTIHKWFSISIHSVIHSDSQCELRHIVT